MWLSEGRVTVAAFKKAARLINKHSTQEDQEWMMETAYNRKHRLKGAAIENRQAAIRGTPRPSEEDAGKIMRMLMAMRGLDKKKHIDLWRKGDLKVLPQKLKMQGAAQAWRKVIIKGDVWNEDMKEEKDETLTLKEIKCPECNHPQSTFNIRMKVKDGSQASNART